MRTAHGVGIDQRPRVGFVEPQGAHDAGAQRGPVRGNGVVGVDAPGHLGFGRSDQERDRRRQRRRGWSEDIVRQRGAVDDGRCDEGAAAGGGRLHRAEHLFDRQPLQLGGLVRFQAKAGHERLGVLGGGAGRHAGDRGSALRDRAMKQALRRGHTEQRAHFSRAARLAEDRDVPGIAAEAIDVVADPLEARDDVLLSCVAGVREGLAAELREMDEAEDVQPVRDADDDHVVAARQVGAVVRQRGRRSAGVAAAVQPDHHRTRAAARGARRPDVQVQTVFAHRLGAGQRLPLGYERRDHLRRSRAERERLADAGPRRGLERRQKPARARRRCAVGDRLE